MTDQTTAPTEPKPAEAPQETLEQLYSEFETPAPKAETSTEQKPVEGETAIRDEIGQLKRKLEAFEQSNAQAQDEADLTSTVKSLGKEAAIEGKETLIRGFLIAKASEDSRFRTLWNNRNQNPTAWEKATKILAKDFKDQFEIPNPQLEADQRAMDESQRAATTTAPAQPDRDHKVMGMNDGDFNQFWQRLSGRG